MNFGNTACNDHLQLEQKKGDLYEKGISHLVVKAGSFDCRGLDGAFANKFCGTL